jgi:hypothetical protein
MGGTLKIIDVDEGENLTCRARSVKQVTRAGYAGGARGGGGRGGQHFIDLFAGRGLMRVGSFSWN